MSIRVAPGTYTNDPLGKELTRTNRLSEAKEAYPVARTTRATPILGDFGPVNYERFTRPDCKTVIVVILLVIIVGCILMSMKNKSEIKPVETYTPIATPVQSPMEEISYPSLEGGAAKRRKRTIRRDIDDDLDGIYGMKKNGMLI